MDVILGVFFRIPLPVFSQDLGIIYEFDAVAVGICADHVVHLVDRRRHVPELRPPRECGGRGQGAENRLDVVQFRKFAHRLDIAHYPFYGNRAVVAGDVVDSGKDYDLLRIKVYDILPETDDHLACRLSADPASQEIVLLEEIRILPGPCISNGIPVKDCSRTGGILSLVRLISI